MLQSNMHHPLKLHPDSRCVAVTDIGVEVARARPGELRLGYVVTGKIGALRLPPVTASARADNLWQHTCFEAFLRPGAGAAYCEFNFAPSTQWAGYGFTEYREGMRALTALHAPHIAVQSGDTHYRMQITLDLDALPDLTRGAIWRVGLSAVIEETDGNKSYWALKHPPGKPDFHHSDCFALALAAASRP